VQRFDARKSFPGHDDFGWEMDFRWKPFDDDFRVLRLTFASPHHPWFRTFATGEDGPGVVNNGWIVISSQTLSESLAYGLLEGSGAYGWGFAG
jgi:hypothetical protein